MMISFDFNNRNSLAVGRAATAIYLILINDCTSGKKVMLPGNICYAAVYPILYAGMQPCFCDVDKNSGNVNTDAVKQALTDDIAAMIIPHMYGNPVIDMPEISKMCKDRGIVLIQDCASAMGIEPEDYDLASIADYTVFSTGYSKTVDLGIGGILYSLHKDIDVFYEYEKTLNYLPEDNSKAMSFFSSLYRLIRSTGDNLAVIDQIFRMLPEVYRSYFLFRIKDDLRDLIFQGIKILPEMIRRRKEAYKMYNELLKGNLDSIKYEFYNGAVPWRYNILVAPRIRAELINTCLNNGIAVSDWYPSVLPLFGFKQELYNVSWHEKRILNFPLLIPENEIKRICNVILDVIKNGE